MNQTSNLLNHYNLVPFSTRQLINEFSKPPFDNTFRTNLTYLLKGADLVKFRKDLWVRRPEIFCLDHYDEPDFFHIILLANNIGSRFTFAPEYMLTPFYIVAPQKQRVIDLLDLIF